MIYKSYLIEKDINIINEKIILIYGENLGLKNELKIKIKNKILKKDCELIRVNEDDIMKNRDIIFNEMSNDSLFNQKKIFFINDATDKILDTILEAEKIITNQEIYLFSDILEKKSKLRNHFEKSKNCAVVACYGDNEITIKNIIQNKLKSFTGLTPININLILENSNLNRSKLYNELTKIINYFSDKKIETNKLEQILDTRINDDFNKLKDEALMGNKIKTNNLLNDTILETEKNIFYVNSINQRLLKILEVKNLNTKNIEQAINDLKPPIFWKDRNNFMVQVQKWNRSKIKETLKETYKIEKNIKSSSILNKNVLIKKLIVDVCEIANA
tara:strand:- start:385 stop:1377 length:993 start_codon:yes stop_codon:yes gene_type:complete